MAISDLLVSDFDEEMKETRTINYGFVPQTVSYDGDPFDALVLGPSLPGGDVARGVIRFTFDSHIHAQAATADVHNEDRGVSIRPTTPSSHEFVR